MLMGSAEIFGSIGSLEYAYSAASRSGQSVFLSLHFFARGIASFIGIGYLSIYSSITTTDFSVCFICNQYRLIFVEIF